MTSGVYNLGFGDLLLWSSHLPFFCFDGDAKLRRESRVKSGDYLATVAIELENIAQYTDDKAIKDALQQIIDEFDYVQEYYQLTKRTHASKNHSHDVSF